MGLKILLLNFWNNINKGHQIYDHSLILYELSVSRLETRFKESTANTVECFFEINGVYTFHDFLLRSVYSELMFFCF